MLLDIKAVLNLDLDARLQIAAAIEAQRYERYGVPPLEVEPWEPSEADRRDAAEYFDGLFGDWGLELMERDEIEHREAERRALFSGYDDIHEYDEREARGAWGGHDDR